jgi:hypothetical protein
MKSSTITGKPMSLLGVISLLLLAVAVINLTISLYRTEIKEKFSTLGSSISYSMGDGVRSSWLSGDNKPKDTNIYSMMETNVAGSNAPLSESEMLIFNNNKFSPQCCPSAYTNSLGCVCATPEQMKYLNAHGGNRTLGGAQNEY